MHTSMSIEDCECGECKLYRDVQTVTWGFRELRDATVYLLSMADFWKLQPTEEKDRILNDPQYREIHYHHLAMEAAQERVWNAGYNFFYGGFHQ